MKQGLVLSAALLSAILVTVGCVPPPDPGPSPATLAVAYSNLDGVDGYDPSGADVLIAQLLDANNDGLVSTGDRVETNKYPLDFEASTFGTFQTTTHTVGEIFEYATGSARFEIGPGLSLWFRKAPNFEYYIEAIDEFPKVYLGESLGGIGEEGLKALSDSPSAPDTTIDTLQTANFTDNAYFDLDLFF